MKYLILVSFFIFSQANAAVLDPTLEVTGVLVGQVGDTVELKDSKTGKNFYVPKSAVENLNGYIPGKAIIKASVLPSDLEKLNPKK